MLAGFSAAPTTIARIERRRSELYTIAWSGLFGTAGTDAGHGRQRRAWILRAAHSPQRQYRRGSPANGSLSRRFARAGGAEQVTLSRIPARISRSCDSAVSTLKQRSQFRCRKGTSQRLRPLAPLGRTSAPGHEESLGRAETSTNKRPVRAGNPSLAYRAQATRWHSVGKARVCRTPFSR